MEKTYWVYILASKRNGSIYTGVTSNFAQRVWEHKEGLVEGHTKEYGINKLVYYESYTNPEEAIVREKRIKKWNRAWRVELVEKDNPQWLDLYNDLNK